MKIEPIDGELGRYFVTSESDSDQKYVVDLLENPLSDSCAGRCGCRDWETRRQPRVNQATHWSGDLPCKHIEAATAQFGRDMAFSIWKDQQKRLKPENRKANGP